MSKLSSMALLAFLGLFLIALAVMADYDADNYCGVPPYPTPIPDLPSLKPHPKIPNPRLVFFHTFIRHGDRSTIAKKCFPGLPNLSQRVWEQCPDTTSSGHNGMKAREIEPHRFDLNSRPLEHAQILDGNCHSGQLSQRGALMSYNNGLRVGRYLTSAFRRSGAEFGPKTLNLRSTDYHRTRETATSFITGLLDNMPYSPQVMDHVVPIGWIDAATDGLKINSHLCNAAEYLKEVYDSEEWVEYMDTTWKPLQELVGSIVKEDQPDLHDVFDCAKTYLCHQYELPQGYLQLADKRVEDVNTRYWQYAFTYDHTRSSKVFSGILIMDLLKVFTKIATGGREIEPSFTLYSGHDFGPMMNIIALLQIDKLIWPPYSAMLNVEMYHVKDDTKSYMRFIYNGTVYVPKFCTNDAIGELCPTSTVLTFLQTLVPSAEDCPKMPRGFSVDDLEQVISEAKEAMGNGSYTGVDLTIAEKSLDSIKRYNSQLMTLKQQQQRQLHDAPRSHIDRWNLEALT